MTPAGERPVWFWPALFLLVLGLGGWGMVQSGLWHDLTLWVVSVQRDLHRALATAIAAVKEQGFQAGLGLITLGFLYGVFHAAGPGHGKVVITTYLATQETRLSRGLLLANLSAQLQGVTAVAAVTATVWLLGQSFREAQGTATALEMASYVLLGLVGSLLAGRSIWRLSKLAREDAVSAGCCHNHGADGRQAEGSWREFLLALASIGFRPCAGAVLVLVLAHALDLVGYGILAVFAMSFGTGLAISVLAVIAVMARRQAISLLDRMGEHERRMTLGIEAISLAGGIVILFLAVSLFQTAQSLSSHPLF
ncbi:MAG: nickel/cobalt transporter [Geminicoccaceae bacterium]